MERFNLRTSVGNILNFLLGILIISGILELILFPSWDNIVGTVVSIVSLILYGRFVFRYDIMCSRPISFIAFSALILFMYLPLPITLLDGNEMSHHLYCPKTTYLLQLVYFVCCIIAFNMAGRYSRNYHGVRVFLKKLGYFSTPSLLQLWVLGLIGWLFKYFLLSSQFTEESINMAGKGTLSIFASFIYAPLLILFYPLIGGRPVYKSHQIFVIFYLLAMMILLVATNSRNQVITPLFMVLICFIIMCIYKRRLRLSVKHIALSILLLFIIVGPLSDLAFAMLMARSQRHNTEFTTLLKTTLDIYSDKEHLYKLKSIADNENEKSNYVYTTDWNEYYVSSIFLNRVCNYRVIDASIYHAQRAGMPNKIMLDDFLVHLMIMFPQPVVDLLFGHIDKSKYAYSPQDKLYEVSSNGALHVGYKVGGDVGLALSMFGLFAFPILIFVYMLEFILFDNLVYRRRGGVGFSFLTLISIYSTYFLRFQVGGGVISHVNFLLWGFPFNLVMLLIVYNVVKRIVPSVIE